MVGFLYPVGIMNNETERIEIAAKICAGWSARGHSPDALLTLFPLKDLLPSCSEIFKGLFLTHMADQELPEIASKPA